MQSKLVQMLFAIWMLQLFISCNTDTVEGPEPSRLTADENTWIFLMAGQSNMAGRGVIEHQDIVTDDRIITLNVNGGWVIASEPLHFYEPGEAGLDCGMSFAREMLNNIPDSITIAMVPCAVGGSSVFQWLNDEEHRGVRLLSNFREKVLLSRRRGVIKGILWHQGERNANAEDLPEYEEALLQLFSKFRTIVQDDTLPIVLGELGRFAQPEEKAGYFENVNQMIKSIAEGNDHCYLVSSEGLEDNGDHLHFNSEAQRELGKRYASEMIRILVQQ